MIAAAIRPLLNAQVQHWLPPVRDIHGKQAKAGDTSHAARVTYTPGSILAPASNERMGNAAAIVWLVNHPRPIAIGDTFELPTGEVLKVLRAELPKHVRRLIEPFLRASSANVAEVRF